MAGGSDYEISNDNNNMTFLISFERPSFNIELINDDIFELDETFVVMLSFAGPPPPRANFTSDEFEVTLVDDDCKLKLWDKCIQGG